jgi:hypothetical protein|nr:MAG TPA: hypothetical protein [Herelleviridae sp.]
MNKLGFTITRANQGVAKLIECNKGDWSSKVVDVRDYLKLFSGLQGTDNSITFISFDEGGCFLNQLRAISGRAGDNLCGWIYIPNTIDITSEEIKEAYEFVEKILSQSNINDSKEKIEDFFSKEYQPKKNIFKYAPSSGEKYGVRYLGRYSKKEILGENCYQQYYSGYKAIFLVDPNGDVQPSNEQMFVDLTKEKICEACIFLPPSENELKGGTKIKFKNGSEFNSPILTYKNEKIELFFTRKGFEPVKCLVTILEDGQKLELGSQSIEWKKTVKRSMFKFFDQDEHTHAEIKEYIRIRINGTELTEQGLSISETDCKSAKVEIYAPGYEILKLEKVNLLNNMHEIKLCRKEKSCEYGIQLVNGREGRMIIESKYLPPKEESPLKGYNEDRGVLKLSSTFIYKQRLLGFLQGLGALLLICACFFIYYWIDAGYPFPFINKEKTSAAIEERNDSREKDQDEKETSYQLADAIKYLDNNTVWDKLVMEKYPDLQGLFEAMNEFRLEELTKDWAFKLKDSKNFQKVCESAQKNLDKNWNPKQGTHQPTYNKPSDGQVNLTNYINWLSQDQTPQAPTQNEGFHPEEPIKKSVDSSNKDKGNSAAKKSVGGSTNSGKKKSSASTDKGNKEGFL